MDTLIPKEILESIPDLYSSTETKDPLCIVKLFTPDANWTWYIIEHSKEDGVTCYGYVQGLENELGYFSLEEIASVRGAMNLAVERDLSFKSTKLSEIINHSLIRTPLPMG